MLNNFKKLDWSFVLVTVIVVQGLITGFSFPASLLGCSLVALNFLKHWVEGVEKQRQVKFQMDYIDAAIESHKKHLSDKVGALESRLSTILAVRKV